MGAVRAVLLGPDDETLTELELMLPGRAPLSVKWCPPVYVNRSAVVDSRIVVIDLILDSIESELATMIAGETVAVYRWPR